MAKKKLPTNPIEEEKAAAEEAEALPHHSQEASVDASATNLDEEAEKATTVEEGADADQVVPAEVAAIHPVPEPDEKPESKLGRKKAKKTDKAAKTKPATKPKSSRSAKYAKAKEQLEPGKHYNLAEAIELVKKVSLAKFDGAVEIHIRLNKKKSKTSSNESTRMIAHLPHGTGKKKNIIVLDEAKIEQIAKTQKIDFDSALATPELMPKVAKIARILGPRGLMPDPKSGTVTSDPKKTIEEIHAGKTEFRLDPQGIIHLSIGRVSWETAKLSENIKAVLGLYPKTRYASIHLAASIGPSVPVDVTSL